MGDWNIGPKNAGSGITDPAVNALASSGIDWDAIASATGSSKDQAMALYISYMRNGGKDDLNGVGIAIDNAVKQQLGSKYNSVVSGFRNAALSGSSQADNGAGPTSPYTDLQKKYMDAANELMTLDPNSKLAQNVLNAAQSNTLSQTGNASGQYAGQGGLSQSNAQMMNTNALYGLDAQRKQLGLAALSGAGNTINNAANYDLNLQQLNAGADAAAFNAAQGQRQGIGSLIGGLGGALLGIPGGPAGMAAGGQLGAGLGGGIGGMTAGPYKPYRYTPYGGGSGLSGGGRINNY